MDASTTWSGQANYMRQAVLWVLRSILVLVFMSPALVDAQVPQVVTTSIISSGLNTQVNQVGNSYNITGGTRPVDGPNLFHSFGDFSVGQGDIANFLNDSGLQTSNILGRVTELGVAHTSFIYGTIQTTDFGNANLFLINPSGIVFGPHGSVNVGGSVSLSTANYLRFEGTATLFDMLSTPASLGQLSVAPVVAFGFLGPGLPAPITVQGSILQVPEGRSLSLVGGDITVQAGTLGDGTIQAASLRAPSGQINLVSVASPGEVLVPGLQTGPNIEGASFNAMGTVRLKQGATLDVSGQSEVDAAGNPIGGNSGTVFVRGGQLVMDASTILANTVGPTDGASTAVDIQVSQNVVMTNGAQIVSRTDGPGDGGGITISATDTVSISGFDTTGTLSGVTTPFFIDPNTGLPLVTSGVFRLYRPVEMVVKFLLPLPLSLLKIRPRSQPSPPAMGGAVTSPSMWEP